MKVCPKCGKVIGFNSYFGAYICDDCGWEDNSYYQERVSYFSKKREDYDESKETLESIFSASLAFSKSHAI